YRTPVSRRGIAQSGSASALGAEGRRFKSCCPDHPGNLLAIVTTAYRPIGCHRRERELVARIYKPAKTAMQSGFGNTKGWVLDFEPETPRRVEPMMGWASSSDMRKQLWMRIRAQAAAAATAVRLERGSGGLLRAA